MAGWRIRVDAGGTFTDGWAMSPAGEVRRAKVLSSSAVRGVVVDRDGAHAILVRGTWAGSPQAAVGLRLSWPGGSEAMVLEADATSRAAIDGQPVARLRLDDGPPPPPGLTVHLTSPEPAAVLCARVLCDAPVGTPLPPGDFRVATTRATNALLERRGARVAVLVTCGFGDLPVVGDQRRPDLFARLVRRPAPLHERVVEVDERVAPDGTVERPLDEARVAAIARSLRAEGIEAAAVCLLHAVRHPDHERRVAAILREAGIEHVSTSVDGAARGPLVPRLATTIADAFTGPVLTRHLEAIAAAAAGGSAAGTEQRGPRLGVLASDGGVRPAAGFRSAEGLLSGPAGGVLAAAAAARRNGFERAIGLDMGGTSTDVCRIEGDPVLRGQHRVGDATVLAPAMAIETVAAGGGSICHVTGGRLRVGPQSAGAEPGPACHGGGGPLTLTDCTLLLGRLVAERFPFPPDVAAAERAAAAVLEAVREQDPAATGDAVLAGACELAAESMADAIRAVTVREGWDPADHALVAFGGAGGQHACAIAERLGIGTIVFPADASILSAVGVDAAGPRAVVRREVLAAVEDGAGTGTPLLATALAAAEAEARRRLIAEGVDPSVIEIRDRRLHARHPGQEATLEVAIPGGLPEPAARLRERFAAVWRRTFGHDPADDRVEIESVEVRAGPGAEPGAGVPATTASPDAPTPESSATDPPVPVDRRVHLDGRWRTVPVLERAAAAGAARVDGPAIIVEDRTSIVLAAGWRLEPGAAGDLLARRV
ncbi:MAG: hydantoinase/oxoprolinase family protein, partial [Planctomycetota bacterium]